VWSAEGHPPHKHYQSCKKKEWRAEKDRGRVEEEVEGMLKAGKALS
jgi:hypothetical protein